MICAVTVRQLKPDTYERFREAWEPTCWKGHYSRVVVLRNDDNPDQVLTIGYFDKTFEEFDALRDDPELLRGEEARLRAIAEFEDSILVNGVYILEEELPA